MNSVTAKVKHPRGLYVLFFTEMWERFGFYLMIGILPLFLRATDKGGKGLDVALSIDIVGTYVALVYLTPFIGGLLADRFLGYRKSIFIGGALMALGYMLLGINGNNTLLFAALGCVIVGNGFFKPNISTLLGNIYNTEELKSKKDVAYNVFYMGVNIGAFICNFVAAYLRIHYNWGYAFMAAGVGMVIGLIIFAVWQKDIKHGDVMKPVQKEDMPMKEIVLKVFLPAIIAGTIGWFIPGNLIGSDSNDAFIFACLPVILFYYNTYRRCEGFDKKRMSTLFVLFGVAIIFWNIYNQNSTALTIWAETYTKRETPPAAEKLLTPFGFLEKVNTNPMEVPKMDNQFKTTIGTDGKVITEMGLNPYFKNIPVSKIRLNDFFLSFKLACLLYNKSFV